MKLNAALDVFLKLDRSPQSNSQYRYTLNKLVTAIGPERRVDRVRYEDLVDYFAELRKTCKPITVASYIAICKAFFNWCVECGYCPASPARLLRQRNARRAERIRAIPADELQRMVDFARATSPRNYALILFLVDTACRIGGAQSLLIARLDLAARTASLTEKGQRIVDVYFSEITADALRHWLTLRPAVAHPAVWTGPRPAHATLTVRGLSDIIRRLAQQTGASRAWGPHSIRHSVAFAYQRSGVAPNITQRKLNHERVETTLRNYYPDGVDLVKEASRALPLSALGAAEPPPLRLVKR